MANVLPDDHNDGDKGEKSLSEPTEKSPEEEVPVKISYHGLKDDPLDDESSSPTDEDQNVEEDDEEKEEGEVKEPQHPENSEDTTDSGSLDEPEKPDQTAELPQHQFKQELVTRSEVDTHDQYYLQVVRTGEAPEWPRPKEDLDVFSQPLEGGLIQYWAYLKDLGKTADSMPHAEEIASRNQSVSPMIIIDQVADHLSSGSCLELVLVKGGHALAKTDSNLDNLESNITSLLDLAKQNFGITAEHFMSTDNVSPEVEKRLNDLEEAEEEGGEKKDIPQATSDDSPPVKEYNQDQREDLMEEDTSTSPYFTDRPAITNEKKGSKMVVFIPIVLLIIIFGGVVFYRDQLFSKMMNKINPPKPVAVEVTPTPTAIPTPTITVDRSKYKVRVLNGTPQTGAAGVLAAKLKELGWQIDRTGNATSSAIAESFVRSKTGMDEAIETLISDVGDYVAASSSSQMKTADKADLEFVIGKQ